MRIGICDDDKKWREYAGNVIIKHLEKTSLEIELVYFSDRESILNYSDIPLDAILIDIEFGEDNGIKIAAIVNKKWSRCQVIYLSNYRHYVTDVYSTNHIYYVLKKQFKEKIGEIIGKILRGMEQKKNRIIFSVIGGEYISLMPEEIIYFERNQRETRIYTVWGEFRIWDKIGSIIDILPELDFVRCHNSYIVYLPAIRKMDKKSFHMNNGNSVSISRGYSKKVETAFINWAKTQLQNLEIGYNLF